jgi:hypothetical protein
MRHACSGSLVISERVRDLVVGDTVDLEVERHVVLAVGVAVVGRDRRAHGLVQRAQLFDLMQRDVLRRQRRRIAFEQDAQIEDLLNFAPIELRYSGRAVGQPLKGSFGDQALDGLANRCVGDRETRGQGAQGDQLAGPERTGQDRLFEGRVCSGVVGFAGCAGPRSPVLR